MRALIGIVIVLVLVGVLPSCHTAQWHYQKFKEKGGKIEPVTIRDSFPYFVKGKDGKDSLIYVDVEIPCPEPKAPKTNSQTRQEERTRRNESDNERKKYEADLKNAENLANIARKAEKDANNTAEKLAKENRKLQSDLATEVRKTEKHKSKKFPWWLYIVLPLGGWAFRFLGLDKLIFKLIRKCFTGI